MLSWACGVFTWGGSSLAERLFGLLAQPAVLVVESRDLGSQRVGSGLLGVLAGS
jgi:hypothetical protein